MFGGLTAILKALLEMDHIGVETTENSTIYKFKTTGLFKSTAELKSKILSVLDLPVDIPKNISIKEAKRGKVFKEYIIEITVPNNRIGQLTDLLARKYPIIPLRRRRYSGEYP